MSDLAVIKDIMGKLEQAEIKVQSSDVSESYKKELQKTLTSAAEQPLEYQKIYRDRAENMRRNAKHSIQPKITVKISLDEQKQNIETVLSNMLAIIPQLTTQLDSMKDKGYYNAQEKITERERTRIQKPREGMIGDRGIYHDNPVKLKYIKKPFTNKEIDENIQTLTTIQKKASSLLKSTQSIQIPEDNVFAKDNIAHAQKQTEEDRKKIREKYRNINPLYAVNDIDDKYFDVEYVYRSKEHDEVGVIMNSKFRKMFKFEELNEILNLEKNKEKSTGKIEGIQTRPFNKITPGEDLNCTIPEIEETLKISLTTTKDIENPRYTAQKEEMKTLRILTKELAELLMGASAPAKILNINPEERGK